MFGTVSQSHPSSRVQAPGLAVIPGQSPCKDLIDAWLPKIAASIIKLLPSASASGSGSLSGKGPHAAPQAIATRAQVRTGLLAGSSAPHATSLAAFFALVSNDAGAARLLALPEALLPDTTVCASAACLPGLLAPWQRATMQATLACFWAFAPLPQRAGPFVSRSSLSTPSSASVGLHRAPAPDASAADLVAQRQLALTVLAEALLHESATAVAACAGTASETVDAPERMTTPVMGVWPTVMGGLRAAVSAGPDPTLLAGKVAANAIAWCAQALQLPSLRGPGGVTMLLIAVLPALAQGGLRPGAPARALLLQREFCALGASIVQQVSRPLPSTLFCLSSF